MESLVEQMADYAAHHRQPRTKLTHFVGVPVIVLALLVLLARVRFEILGFSLDLAVVLVLLMLAWYLVQDVVIGLALALLVTPLLGLAEGAARLPWPGALATFLVLFVGGWLLQLWGHRIEGNRPAFLDNLQHLIVAPAYLTAELLFALRLRPKLRAEIERRVTAIHDTTGRPG